MAKKISSSTGGFDVRDMPRAKRGRTLDPARMECAERALAKAPYQGTIVPGGHSFATKADLDKLRGTWSTFCQNPLYKGKLGVGSAPIGSEGERDGVDLAGGAVFIYPLD